jgi:exopolyphosphatase/guanosine-5'-triphosphate,3'-diphosphate pyrophosphatase
MDLSARRQETVILAALDVGTNSSLFLLAEVAEGGRIVALRHEVRTNDLGRGLNDKRELTAEAIELNLTLLRDFKQMAHDGGAQEFIIAGTEALRRASNAAHLIERAHRELGLKIRIITGEEEADLTFRGVISGLEVGEMARVVADVGGGSTEIIFGQGRRLLRSFSLPLGAVALDRQFIRHDPAQPQEISEIRNAIRNCLSETRLCEHLSDEELIICGGTASALASADLGLATYQPEKLGGHRLTRERVSRFIEQFAALTLDQRRAIPGIGRRRAEIILPGTLIIAELLATFGRQDYSTSERGLRYGLLLSGQVLQ